MKLSINDILNSVLSKIGPYGPKQKSDTSILFFQEKAFILKELVKTSAIWEQKVYF